MQTITISKKKRRLLTDEFDDSMLALLGAPQRALLISWLKIKASKPKWDTLLKIAVDQGGQSHVELAYELALSLTNCGAVVLEQRHEGFVWQNSALIWRNFELLCTVMGLSTAASRRTVFESEWDAARDTNWERSSIAEQYLYLTELPSHRASARLKLLLNLNAWLVAGKTGTRYEFSLFGFGQTKHEISRTEWAWLEESIGLEGCGIQRHSPALWLAGDIQIEIGGRWLDIGAACDAVAITPNTLVNLNSARTKASRYRLVENRTSFERLARLAHSNSQHIVIWLPGYAPSWWRSAVSQLIDVCSLPADISCDADPDGVQIAMQASTLWSEREISWNPMAMNVENVSNAKHLLKMNEHDMELAARLLRSSNIPLTLVEMLEWCVANGLKAEQENWIGI